MKKANQITERLSSFLSHYHYLTSAPSLRTEAKGNTVWNYICCLYLVFFWEVDVWHLPQNLVRKPDHISVISVFFQSKDRSTRCLA